MAVYKVKKRHRTDLKWPIPRGEAKDHFTTWSACCAVLVTILALLTIPWMRCFPSTHKVAAFTIVVVSMATMAFVMCTNIVSQLMFSFNTDIYEKEKEKEKEKQLAVSVGFMQKVLKYHFLLHVFPLLVVVVLGLGITLVPSPSTLLGKGTVFLTSFLLFCVFVLAWMLTPVHTKTGTHTGWEKIMYIYRDPNPYYFTVVFPCVAILVLLVTNFALYGALNSVGMKGF